MTQPIKIGLIAGGGQFPLLFAAAAAKKGYQVHAAAYVNEASQDIEKYVASVEWLFLGQLGRLIRFFKKNDITQVVMMGSVKKTRIFTDIKPDLKAMAFIAKMRHTHDDSVLRAFAVRLEREGIAIKPSTFLLPELIAPKGCWTKRNPGRAEKKDIRTGWRMAKEIGRLDIGQCVIVSNGTVLAVEAAEGTDAAIRRGGALAESGAVVVKLSKPNQDLRFDLPSSGTQTIKTMQESGASLLVLEAGKTIAFDREEMVRQANSHNISIIALDEDGV
ncbi:MAG: UDP-2,3-diacylglucosamine diphosphatase LpxI [Thermodesulfobacteriota bacterium]|nr:UDP-2,3-diacylglucosamine diphosphatase LpxI [Thermodesulfobacteriota bacterium]